MYTVLFLRGVQHYYTGCTVHRRMGIQRGNRILTAAGNGAGTRWWAVARSCGSHVDDGPPSSIYL